MTPKKIAAFAVGPIGGAVLSLISLPLLTWFFAQEDIGRLSMLQVTISFSVLLFSLGLDQAYVREFHETENKPSLLKVALAPGLMLLVVAISLIETFGGSLSYLLFEVESWQLSTLIAIVLIAGFISRFLSLILRMNERGFAFSMSQVLPKLLLLAIVGAYIVWDVQKSLLNLVVANTSATFFVLLIFAWNTRNDWIPAVTTHFDRNLFNRMIKFGSPLIIGGVAFWGLTAVDKVFLRSLSSFEELGLYSVSVSFAAAAIILQSIFSTVWAPTVYKWASKGEGLEKVHSVTRYMLCIVVFAFIGAGLLSWIITYLLPSEYDAVQWIVVACFGYPLLYTLSETTVVGIGISRRSSFSMLASVIAFLVNIVGNWYLIPVYGAAGAAVSTCIAFYIFFILRTEFSIYLWRPLPRFQLYFLTTVCVGGASMHTLFATNLPYGVITSFWLVFLIIWGVLFKREITKATGFVKLLCVRKVRCFTR